MFVMSCLVRFPYFVVEVNRVWNMCMCRMSSSCCTGLLLVGGTEGNLHVSS